MTTTATFAQSLALAAGLSTLTGCATTGGLMPPTDQPGLTLSPYRDGDVAARLTSAIERDYHLSGIEVRVGDSFLTDLNNDGVSNDLAGSAYLRSGSRFKSFIFLMTDGGSARFLEANGGRFDPSTAAPLACTESKPIACQPTFERAYRQLRAPSFRIANFDAAQAGLEIAFHYDDGSHGYLNAPALFRSE